MRKIRLYCKIEVTLLNQFENNKNKSLKIQTNKLNKKHEKNYFTQVLAAFTFFAVFTTSCKKEIPLTQEIQLEKSFLKFKTVDQYAQIFENSEIDRVKLIEKMADEQCVTLYIMKTNNRKNVSQDDPIQQMMSDDIMGRILNRDWIVQIGEYLYRINPVNESVFVMHSDFKDKYYIDLVSENMQNERISAYSTTENVIELVENKIQSKALFCKENGCGARSAMTPFFNYASSAWGAQFELAHKKFGVYFKISANVYSRLASRFDLYFERCIFKPTCVSATDRSHSWVKSMVYSGGANNCFQHKIYDGLRNLNKYHIKGYVVCPNTPLGPDQSTTIEIRIGY